MIYSGDYQEITLHCSCKYENNCYTVTKICHDYLELTNHEGFVKIDVNNRTIIDEVELYQQNFDHLD